MTSHMTALMASSQHRHNYNSPHTRTQQSRTTRACCPSRPPATLWLRTAATTHGSESNAYAVCDNVRHKQNHPMQCDNVHSGPKPKTSQHIRPGRAAAMALMSFETCEWYRGTLASGAR